jgi:hypothetical protein
MATEEPEPILVPVEPVGPVQGFRWKYALWLSLACVVASTLMVPYAHALLIQAKNTGIPPGLLPIALALGVVIESMISLGLILLGVALGESIGLAWPPLVGWNEGSEGARRGRAALAQAVGLGVLLGVLLLASSGLFRGTMPGELKHPAWWRGLLAAVGAGVREEVWLRLGLLTFFAWIGTRLTGPKAVTPGVFWTAKVVAAILFGAMHLPQAAQLLGLTGPIVAFVLLGNGVPGLVFGWLYWRKGLLAAMASHFALDVVLKVVVPLLGG